MKTKPPQEISRLVKVLCAAKQSGVECDQQDRLHQGYAKMGIKSVEGQSTGLTDQEYPKKGAGLCLEGSKPNLPNLILVCLWVDLCLWLRSTSFSIASLWPDRY